MLRRRSSNSVAPGGGVDWRNGVLGEGGGRKIADSQFFNLITMEFLCGEGERERGERGN